MRKERVVGAAFNGFFPTPSIVPSTPLITKESESVGGKKEPWLIRPPPPPPLTWSHVEAGEQVWFLRNPRQTNNTTSARQATPTNPKSKIKC